MPTLIYSPGIKVYIDTAKNGIVDVSEDLTEGTMVRRSDGVSTFNFSLSNPRRKYDSVFTPNDRIVVVMKRITWVRTFTGLLNTVPLVSAWPKVVNIAASCSLKRLMYWYWDSYAPATQEMITQALTDSTKTGTDGGITNVVLEVLDQVVGWPRSKVHISQIPPHWFEIAEEVAANVDALAEESDRLRDEFYASLGAAGAISGTIGGTTGVSINGVLKEGTYGGVALSQEQVRNAETIMTVGRSLGGSDRDLVIGLITAMQESTLVNLDHGDRDSIGLFQQRPSQGWGTVAQIMNPTYAATKFFNELLKNGSRNSMSETQAAQAVQRSAYGDRYQRWVTMGREIVRVANAKGATTNPARAAAPGAASGNALSQQAIDFLQKYPHIPYSQGGGSTPNYLGQNPPPTLDCGTFVQAMYLRTTGSLQGMPRYVSGIISWSMANGGKRLSIEQAMNTPGAAMIKVGHHIELAIGDGTTTAGAKHTGTPAKLESSSMSALNSYWDYGITLPGLTYNVGGTIAFAPVSGGGTVTGGDAAGLEITMPPPWSEAPGYNSNDPFDKIFGNNSWNPERGGPESNLAQALTGIRALLNDQPMLPYLMNLFNSTMRSFCSAPNGDLIAWFPDYYGLWGTAAKMVLEPIEVMDFNVEWSDDSFVTHQFTIAGQYNKLDIGTGAVDTEFATSVGPDIRTQTLGIASIDFPAVMWTLFGIKPSKIEAENFAKFIYRRFGARPDYQAMPGLQGPRAEFFSALFMFLRNWAYQYNADVPMTFMPEMWPGMLLQIPAFDFQAYVTTVMHSFRYGEGGSFTTTANISAPARLPKRGEGRDNVLLGLPLAGDYKPGRGTGNVTARPSEDIDAVTTVTGQRRGGGPIL